MLVTRCILDPHCTHYDGTLKKVRTLLHIDAVTTPLE